jgi:hypothetical protein
MVGTGIDVFGLKIELVLFMLNVVVDFSFVEQRFA